jgi:hypothetical protein
MATGTEQSQIQMSGRMRENRQRHDLPLPSAHSGRAANQGSQIGDENVPEVQAFIWGNVTAEPTVVVIRRILPCLCFTYQ